MIDFIVFKCMWFSFVVEFISMFYVFVTIGKYMMFHLVKLVC